MRAPLLSQAPDELLILVEQELRRLARSHVSRRRQEPGLPVTELIDDAYGRLVDPERVDGKGRLQFLAVAALAMRRVLVGQARRRHRLKQVGAWQPMPLEPGFLRTKEARLDPARILGLDRALDLLAELDPPQSKVVVLRYFGGMGPSEVALALGVSPRSVDRDWTHGRSWLRRELAEGTAWRARSAATPTLGSGSH